MSPMSMMLLFRIMFWLLLARMLILRRLLCYNVTNVDDVAVSTDVLVAAGKNADTTSSILRRLEVHTSSNNVTDVDDFAVLNDVPVSVVDKIARA